MTLTEHLREFRNRTFISVASIIVASTLAWIFYGTISDLLIDPILHVQEELLHSKGIHTLPTVQGVASSFILQTKISLVAGIVISSPVWLYQIWAFITPGLHSNERKWTIIF